MKASDHGGHVPPFVGRWSFNNGDETWAHDHFATKEEAITEGRAYYGDDASFEVGVGAEVEVYPPDADGLIERMAEALYEECGESSESFLSGVSKEARAELDEAIDKVVAAWLTKHDEWPTCGTIEQIEKVGPTRPVGTGEAL